jgi:hypothetical protein
VVLRTYPRFHTHVTPTGTSWINQWNSDLKPFVWTKSAEEILESLTA